MFEIKVPAFGESIQEVQVASWLKKPGDWVERDEEIVELESEKASQALTSEQSGVLSEIKVAEGDFAQVGDVLCVLTEGEQPSGESSASSTAAAGASSTTAVADAPPESPADWIMPAAERVLSEYQISADAITPTGPGGRLLKEDVLNFVKQKGLKPGGSEPEDATSSRSGDGAPATKPPAPATSAPAVKSAPQSAPQPATSEEPPAPLDFATTGRST